MTKRLFYTLLLLLWAMTQLGQTPIVDVEPSRNTLILGRGTLDSFTWNAEKSSLLVGGSRGFWMYTPDFQPLESYEHPDVTHVAWQPNTHHFASAQANGTLALWQVDEFNQIQPVATLKHTGSPILKLAWQGNLLAVLVKNEAVEIWDADAKKLVQSYAGQFTALTWHGENLIAANGQLTILQTGQIFAATDDKITALASNGTVLAGGTASGTIHFWDSAGTRLASTKFHTAPINDLAWQENRLASVSGFNFEGSELKIWENFVPVASVAGTSDFVQIAWNQHRVAGLSRDHLIRTWDSVTGGALATLQGHMGSMDTLAWSPDGREIASASSDGLVRIWQAETGSITATLIGHTRGINAVVWSPDGEMLASAGWDNSVRVWMRDTGKTRTVFTGHTRRVWDLAWSADGRWIASASRDQTVQLWNVYTGEIRQVLTGAESDVQSVAWHENQIAGSTDNGVVLVWDTETGNLLHHLTEGHRYYVWSVAWQPQTNALMSSSWHDGVMRLWQGSTILATLNSLPVTAIAWNPTGTTLASASDDGTIRLWDMTDGGKVTRVLYAHDAPIYSLEWRPDGAVLASASEDGTIKLWGE